FYIPPDTLNKASNGLLVPRALAENLGGNLGPGAPYFMVSEHYAAWTHPSHPLLGERLIAYLRAICPHAPLVVSAQDAKHRGIAPLTVRVDARGAGMSLRLFPTKDSYLALNGPPGAPIAVVFWDCTSLPFDLEAAVRAKVVPPWTNSMETIGRDR